MSLVATRQKWETWRQAVERIAKQHGLEKECLEAFDQEVSAGVPQGQAAWNALHDWDCLEFVDDSHAMKAVWCAKDRHGRWCALNVDAKPNEDTAAAVLTKCGDVILLPWGLDKREPTCELCRGKK